MGFISVITFGDRDGAELDGEPLAAGEGEEPGTEPIGRAVVVLAGEDPGAIAAACRE
jgi:hypothetical protein